tara:strand:- start:2725 stop:3690 length:966 start_codon:yes stop_codon:yes gene_type:complete
MTIVSNTFTRYSAVGIREELADVIYNISPQTTPLVSNIGSDSVSNTFYEWQTDSLASAAANAQLDGDDLASFTAVSATVRLGNYTQIMRKDFIIADNLEVIDSAGGANTRAYNLVKVGNELKRDIEFNVCGVNQAAAAGNTSTARKGASLSAYIKSNTSKGTGGADPTVSGGVVNAARTDGTQRAFTEAMLKTVLQAVFTEGGDPSMVMVGPFNKTQVSSFTGIASQRYMAPGDAPTTIIGAADVYISDFGSVSIVPNRFSRERDAYVLDPDLLSMAVLRNIQNVELAKTGDAHKEMVIYEGSLRVDQEAGLGIIADLTTS